MKLSLSVIAIASCLTLSAEELRVVFEDNFDDGFDKWERTDDKTWEHRKDGGNGVVGITARNNSYKPKHRSPYHIALVKGVEVEDFEITFKVRSTKDTGNHRDCCVFFCHQDAEHFYYVHLGAKPDPHSGQIMIVNDAPRKAMTENKTGVPWDGGWHDVKVVRDSESGKISIYFDDMEKPIMETTDKTFGKGRVGIGSFDDMNEFDDFVVRGR